MIKLINALTGVEMWVADERKDEYLRAGHKLAPTCEKPIEEKPEVVEKKTTKRAPRKKK